jgi:hypothetical protein
MIRKCEQNMNKRGQVVKNMKMFLIGGKNPENGNSRKPFCGMGRL